MERRKAGRTTNQSPGFFQRQDGEAGSSGGARPPRLHKIGAHPCLKSGSISGVID
jgi:hypothetical protein